MVIVFCREPANFLTKIPTHAVYYNMLKNISKWFTIMAAVVFLPHISSPAQRGPRNWQPSRPKYQQKDATNPNLSAVKVARLHYSGGGDWYWGGSAVPNLLKYLRDNTDYPVDSIERVVTIMDPELFEYPFLFATGHGVIKFSAEEKERLRRYLAGGGFLFVNDSYGVDHTFRKEMAQLFPEREVVELPFDHPIYHSFYDFSNGPPKIHEHDGKPPRGYAIILNGRVVLYFLVESDIGDGWEDPQVHNDPPEKRLQALKMGVNILTYALLY